MADPSSIVGLIGVAVQIIQIGIQCGSDWKSAPADARSFLLELQSLKTVLIETHQTILVNDDVKDAFQGRHSTLLSELGPSALNTPTQLLVSACKGELDEFLGKLMKRTQGHRLGWERIKGVFAAKITRDAIENLQRRCQTLNSMALMDALALSAKVSRDVKESRVEQEMARDDGKQRVILDWLSSINYAAQQSDFINRRQKGTGQWLLDSPEFQTWVAVEKQTLFCPGIPGAGKTILASVVVEELSSRCREDKTAGLAYIYCNFRRQDEQRAVDLLASLLKQLSQRISPHLEDLYKRHADGRTRLSLEEITGALQSVAASYSRVYVVIDGLDECRALDGCRKRFLEEIFNLQAKCGTNFFATSRHIPDIVKAFGKQPSLEIRASEEDVGRYLDGHMERLSCFEDWNQQLRDEIKTAILDAVDGMFLLAQIYLNSLDDKITPRDVRKALKQLLKQSPDSSEDQKREVLDLAYKDAMERISGQRPGFQRLAEKVLSWITCAKRSLTTLELQHALAVEVGDSNLDTDNIVGIDKMVTVCAGLVTVDEESSIIRLVHYTTQEYFERTQKRWFPDAQEEMATACVTYLSFDVFESGFCQTYKSFDERLRLNPLYDYAARNWGRHAREAQIVLREVIDFLKCRTKVEGSSQVLTQGFLDWYARMDGQKPLGLTGLELAVHFRLNETVSVLVQEQQDLRSNDGNARAPLSSAARGGHVAAIEVLINDRRRMTPLFWAFREWHEAVMKTLLTRGAVVDAKDHEGNTLATGQAYKAVRQRLLEHGASMMRKD